MNFDEMLILLIFFVLIGGPVLAIIALVRVSRLKELAQQTWQLTSRVYDLEKRLAALDGRDHADLGGVAQPEAASASPAVGPCLGEIPAAASKRQPAPAAAIPPIPSPISPAPPAAPPVSRARTDVETLIAGSWLYYLGILALLFAVAFFLKYAFDNNWVGPRGRVGIGVLLGGAMFPLSDWLVHRSYRYFSEGITGLGSAILYLSIWAGWYYYAQFPQAAAFAVMIVITALTAAVAIGRNSQRIAVLAVVGGAITPLLVSTGQNQEVTLFTYLAVLGGGILGISFWRNWKWIAPLQFAATLLYFWGCYATFYARSELAVTLVFATIFFALYAVLPAISGLRGGAFHAAEIATVFLNAFSYLSALRLMLWPEFRWSLTLAVLGLAGVHLLAERATPRKETPAGRMVHIIYAGLALTFVTLAIPIRLDGKWITIAWAIEGAVLVWSGLRIRSTALRIAGIVLFAVAGIRLAGLPFHPSPIFLLNERFLTVTMCAACWLSAFLFSRRTGLQLGRGERQLYYAAAMAANLAFLIALSRDVWDLFGRLPSLGIDRWLAQNLALSVLWLVYAIALLAGGMVRRSPGLRWQALALLGVVVVKVFFVDLSFLQRFYRIVSFLLLGLVLMLVSFFYQRGILRHRGEKSL